MEEAIVYADITLPAEASSPRDMPSEQHSDHRPCPHWHWIVMWTGLAGNIVLVAAVLAMGVWGRNKNEELVGASISSSAHINGHQNCHTGGEENRALEDFKSSLKEELCVNSTSRGQSWEKSNEDCIAKRSQLLMHSDQEFTGSLQKFISEKSHSPVWIGLHVEPTEKKWVWLNGSPLNQTRFPALPLEENHCATLKRNKIDHDQCSQDLHWICQKKSVLI